jgi:hypothetical protein
MGHLVNGAVVRLVETAVALFVARRRVLVFGSNPGSGTRIRIKFFSFLPSYAESFSIP